MQSSPPMYYVIFTAVTALGVLLQAFVLLAIFFALRKSMTEFQSIAKEFKEKALPAIDSTRSLVEEISPKLKVATANLTEVSHTLRQQANHINETVDSVLTKTDVQIRRVDEMVTATFDAVDNASRAFETAISNPVRRVTGVINGVRAGVVTFVGGRKTPRATVTDVTEFPEDRRATAEPAEPQQPAPEQKRQA